jgi:hypothetical protein
MGTLQAALAWAARGFRVFPLEANTKDGFVEPGWVTNATCDPLIIRSWWSCPVTGAERDYNIGCLTTDWIVADVDTKKGKPGLRTMAELALDFDTLTVATPSSGYHLYYRRREEPTGQSPLGEGIDVRSHNGYVVAPGSTIDGVEYRVVVDQLPADFPIHLRHCLQRPRVQSHSAAPSIDLDQPEFIEIASHWLRNNAPKAIEGQNGDDTTYRVCCRVRDFGCSADTCADLLMEIWNPTCSPPWEAEELRHKVENAYAYATGDVGSATAAAAFANITILDPPRSQARPEQNGTPYAFGNALPVSEIEKRPWVFGNILLNRTVTGLVAASGSGKSLAKLILAAHIAVGKDWLGHKCFKAGKSIVFDAEDDVKEMSRRLFAICLVYKLDWETVRRNVCLVSQDEILLQLTTSGQYPSINNDQIVSLVEKLRDPEVVMLAVGPLVELHSQPENDSITMRYVMGVLKLIAREGDVAVLVDHHTAKPPVASSQAWVGDQYAGRGSSAFPAAVRRMLTMYAASDEDCADLAVPIAQRKDFVRLDDGKVSYGRAGGVRWLRWTEVRLSNGDDVGVLAPYDVKDSVEGAARLLAGVLIAEMRKSATALMKLEDAIGLLMRDPLVAREGRATTRNRLERALTEPVTVDGVEVSILRGAKGIEGIQMR